MNNDHVTLDVWVHPEVNVNRSETGGGQVQIVALSADGHMLTLLAEHTVATRPESAGVALAAAIQTVRDAIAPVATGTDWTSQDIRAAVAKIGNP